MLGRAEAVFDFVFIKNWKFFINTKSKTFLGFLILIKVSK